MELSKFIARFIFVTSFSSVLLGLIVSIFFQYNEFKSGLNHFKKEFTEQKKREVKNEVLMLHGLVKYKDQLLKETIKEKLKARVNKAYSIAMSIYENNKNTKTEDEIKHLIAETLKNFTFEDDSNYFFINSNKGQAILFNKEIKLDKYVDVWNLKDAEKKLIIKE